MPPKGKGKKTESAPAVVEASAHQPLPSGSLPDIGSGPTAGPSLLDINPGGDNVVSIGDLPNPNGGLPSVEKLRDDLHNVLGSSAVPNMAGGLGDQFLPILSAKVDTLRDSLMAAIAEVKESIISEVTARLNAMQGDTLANKKGLEAIRGLVESEVLPALVRIEGAVSDDEEEEEEAPAPTPVATPQVQTVNTPAPSPTGAAELGNAHKNWVHSYGQHLAGHTMKAGDFASQFVTKHAGEDENNIPTIPAVINYLSSLGWFHPSSGNVTFPAKQG